MTKKTPNSFSVVSAEWSSWKGGQPGIGGTTYEVVLESIIITEQEVLTLLVDDSNVPISGFVTNSAGQVVITAVENRSSLDEPVGGNQQRPSFREKDPAKAYLTLKIDSEEKTVNLNFTKKDN
ncbi:MAG: hypothetical protein AAF789_03300 [Bacteroidota bacterium]